jgi:hypothetical protein
MPPTTPYLPPELSATPAVPEWTVRVYLRNPNPGDELGELRKIHDPMRSCFSCGTPFRFAPARDEAGRAYFDCYPEDPGKLPGTLQDLGLLGHVRLEIQWNERPGFRPFG